MFFFETFSFDCFNFHRSNLSFLLKLSRFLFKKKNSLNFLKIILRNEFFIDKDFKILYFKNFMTFEGTLKNTITILFLGKITIKSVLESASGLLGL